MKQILTKIQEALSDLNQRMVQLEIENGRLGGRDFGIERSLLGELHELQELIAAVPEVGLWYCPECGIVYYQTVVDPSFLPTCNKHLEHWPDGEYSRNVELKPVPANEPTGSPAASPEAK